MLAAADTIDLARVLLDLLVVMAAGKIGAELAERLRVPAVVGEIVAGIAVGPSVLGLVELAGDREVSLRTVAEIGVLLLLVQVGMEMDIAELGSVGRASMTVALIGVATPLVGGIAAGAALGQPRDTAIFLGAALTATSVGLTARVFGDLRALATVEARVVLGAAVADDVIGLIILTVVVKVVAGDAVTVGTVLSTVLLAVGFLVVCGFVGLRAAPAALDAVHRWSRSGTTLSVAALVLVLAFAALADAANLAFIVGAFLAGLCLGRSRHHGRVAADLNSVGTIFIPVFFVQIGIEADLGAMFRPEALATALVLLVVAVAGKLVSGIGATGLRADRLLVGLGMIPRGEVGLIFASIGLAEGVLDRELFGATLLVVLLTTVIAPPLLRWRLGAGQPAAVDEVVSVEPPQGWVTLTDGEIQLHGHPPLRASVPIALNAAALAGGARPTGRLLDWFGERRSAPLHWTGDDTPRLLDVLRTGSARSVRFLDVTGVLARAVPAIADALERRRADPGELDPVGVLRFPAVTRVGELLDDPDVAVSVHEWSVDDLLLAALVIDVVGPDDDPGSTVSLLDQLAVSEPERIEHLLSAMLLMRRASADADGYDPGEVRQLAAHIATTAVADAAHMLAVAVEPTGWHRRALDELHALISDALRHPEQLGERADSLAGSRRRAAEALSHEPGAIDRLRAAPVAHLLAHEPAELARQARLLEPLPPPGVVRVAVSPDPRPDHWVIDVACRDLVALLARLARAITDAGGDIVTATLATWDDGGVVDSFVVRSAVRPRARLLAETMESSLRRDVAVEPIDDLDVSFDNAALPWHTTVIVTGRDRPGALHAVAAAFAAAGVVVHRARISGDGERLTDRFAVGDRYGRKLDETAIGRVRRALAGERPRRRLFG